MLIHSVIYKQIKADFPSQEKETPEYMNAQFLLILSSFLTFSLLFLL